MEAVIILFSKCAFIKLLPQLHFCQRLCTIMKMCRILDLLQIRFKRKCFAMPFFTVSDIHIENVFKHELLTLTVRLTIDIISNSASC